MDVRTGACVVVASVLSATWSHPASAEISRSVFCIAIRTVPKLDQDNYVMGAMGSNYVTPNFATDAPEDELISAWKAFIGPQHPASYPGNPDDTCHPAASRREVLGGQHGDIRNVTVNWTPAKDLPGPAGH
jgi:hypothetical protein